MTQNAWLDYWQTLPAGNLLFTPESVEYASNVRVLLPPGTTVLDYGCGYGAVAKLLAPHVGRMFFWDAAPAMQSHAETELAAVPNAQAWDGTAGGFDAILVNSVVQYLDADRLAELLRTWQSLLKPNGKLILSDLTPVGHSSLADIRSLLAFSLKHRYFMNALKKTLAERGRYNTTVQSTPLFRVDLDWLKQTAERMGFRWERLPGNLTHFRNRVTVVLHR